MTSGDHVSIVISKPSRATCWTARYAAGQRRHTNTSIHVSVWRRTFMHHVVLNATDTTMVFRTVIIQRMQPLHIPTAELDGKGVIFLAHVHMPFLSQDNTSPYLGFPCFLLSRSCFQCLSTYAAILLLTAAVLMETVTTNKHKHVNTFKLPTHVRLFDMYS